MVTTLPLLRRTLILTVSLAVAPLLVSCSQSVSPATSPSPATAPPAASPSAAPSRSATSPTAPSTSSGRRIDITVNGRRVTPAPATVNLAVGQSLTITVTSDRDNTLHAHGFEIERAVKAGQQLEFTVSGTQSGSYEVELHEPALRLLQVAVR